jgi:hypothetical protein
MQPLTDVQNPTHFWPVRVLSQTDPSVTVEDFTLCSSRVKGSKKMTSKDVQHGQANESPVTIVLP